MKCDFSYRHYIETLKLFSQKYSIHPIQNYNKINKKNNCILLRHDVDFSLDHALNLAKEEKKYNFTSTYFILLHSPYYNALSTENSKIISSISNMGHEIGLHYDTSMMPKNIPKMILQLKNESDILSNITGKRVRCVAQHNTSLMRNIFKFIPHDVFIDPMSEEISNDFLYLSDSVQNWRKGCMCKHVGKNPKMQILTHPIWWNKIPMTRNEMYEKLYLNECKKVKKLIKNDEILHKYYFNEILKKEKLFQN